MDLDRLRRLDRMLAEASAMTSAEREAFLGRLRAADAPLADELAALLCAAAAVDVDGEGEHPALQTLVGPNSLDLVMGAFDTLANAGEAPERIADFQLLRRLGAGGMGVVYEAEQTSPRRRVALKLMQPSLGRDRLRRFELEAAVLARLHHPNIAQIYASGTHTGVLGEQPWFAMELIDGVDLRTHVERARLGRREVLALFAQVADGVQHAHERGVVHRDLKPDNVLVDAHGVPKVLDFGVARAHDTSLDLQSLATRTGEIVGTLAYMAPEQLAGDAAAVSERSDVYALGVMLFELCARRLPHAVTGMPLAAAMRLLTEQEPPALVRFDPTARGDVATIVATAMAKEPSRRYATAGALAADLRRHLDHLPIHARPASAVYRATTMLKRNRAVAIGLGIAFAALVVGMALALWQARVAGIERERALRGLYSANLVGADEAWARSEFSMVRRQLDAAPVPYRGFEWQVLSARLDSAAESHRRDQAGAEGRAAGQFELVPVDGTSLLAIMPGFVQVWDRADGAMRAAIPRDSQSDEYTVDLASKACWRTSHGASARTCFVECFHLADGECTMRREIALDARVGVGVFPLAKVSPNGDLLVVCGERPVVVLQPVDERAPTYAVNVPAIVRIEVVEFDAAQRTILLPLTGGEVHWIDRQGRPLAVLAGHTNDVTRCAWSPDGKLLATASRDQSVRLLDMTRSPPVCVRIETHPLQVDGVVFSPSGRRFATASVDHAIRVFDVDSTERLGIYASGNLCNGVVAFLDEDTVAGLDVDGSMHSWNVEAERCVVLRGHRAPVEHLVLVPEFGLLVSGGMDGIRNQPGGLRAFDLATGDPVGAIGRFGWLVEQCGLHAGRLVFGAHLHDPARRVVELSFGDGQWKQSAGPQPFQGSQVDPSGGRFVSLEDFPQKVLIRDLASGSVVATEGGGDGPLHWLQDGSILHCGRERMFGTDGGLFRLDAATLRPQRQWELPGAVMFAVSTDARRVAVTDQARIVVIDLSTNEIVATLLGHDLEIYALAWSPDGSRLASGGLDRTIRLWDTTTFDTVGRFTGHQDAVMALVWDGPERLISASGDDTVRIWETAPIRERVRARAQRQEALARVRPLVETWRQEAGDLPALFARLRADTTLPPFDRRVAQQLAIGMLMATVDVD